LIEEFSKEPVKYSFDIALIAVKHNKIQEIQIEDYIKIDQTKLIIDIKRDLL